MRWLGGAAGGRAASPESSGVSSHCSTATGGGGGAASSDESRDDEAAAVPVARADAASANACMSAAESRQHGGHPSRAEGTQGTTTTPTPLQTPDIE